LEGVAGWLQRVDHLIEVGIYPFVDCQSQGQSVLGRMMLTPGKWLNIIMRCIAMRYVLLCLFIAMGLNAWGGNEMIKMPWTVHYLPLKIEGQRVKMAYMDVRPQQPNGQTVLLMHGKNFNGWYWRGVAVHLEEEGYRVLIPDQIGFGNSSYPNVHYSFHLLAANTRALLDTLGIAKVTVIGHSMGGMLATRFTLMYPEVVRRLILENPIGLEDYRTMVPYTTFDEQYGKELKATYTSYKEYQKSYYPEWLPEYDSLVAVQAAGLRSPAFKDIARANALTYQMIYEQPVCYEFSRIAVPTLLIIGQADRTVVGKALLSESDKAKYGNYPELGKHTAAAISHAKLEELPGVGHIPHIQRPQTFYEALDAFLKE
jgi:pimeloyl-ACP methyl ester carboxylesterase